MLSFCVKKTRPYSTKILPKALSWRDSKVALDYNHYEEGTKSNPKRKII